MEIVLNFEEKELAVNDDCNFVDLHKKAKKLLGDDLPNWTIAGKDVKWIHQYWPTVIYQGQYTLKWSDTNPPYKITYGTDAYTDTIMCFSDNPEHAETEG